MGMNNPYPWAGLPNTSPTIAGQTESAYLNYQKTKEFEDVGWFLETYVVSGGVVTKDVTLNNQIDVTEIVVSIANSLVSRDATSFKTSVASTTYYLDFTAAGDFSFGTAHPTGTQNTDWLAVATVTTDANGNVSVITDMATRGEFRLKPEYSINDAEETVGKTLYVDVINGSDSTGDGSSQAPYKTITFAIATLKKILYTDVKIRVKPGDYTAEGTILVENFSKKYLIITAFDGTNDITTVNDSYILRKMNIDSCDKVMLQGFKVNWDQAADYGIFATNTRFLYCLGIKNDLNTAVNNGFGITVNTEAYLENCLCANKDVVVSCNFGSRVVSVNWDAASTGNRIGLWAHGGSIITKDGTQAAATEFTDFVNDGGKIIEENGNNRTSQVLYTVDASTTGTTSIPINLPIPPSWIKIDGFLSGSAAMSWGQWSINAGTATQSCIFQNNAGTIGAAFDVAQINDGGGNAIQYQVGNLSPTVIQLNITLTGTLSGTVNLNVLCGC